MKPETYTLFMASNRRGTIRKITVPFYALHVLAALSVVGGITVAAAVGSYSRMLWKVGNYNALRQKQDTLQQQYQQLQKTAKDTDQRLSSLQSLATESGHDLRLCAPAQQPSSGVTPATQSSAAPDGGVLRRHTVAQYNFLEKNVTATALPDATDCV